VTGRSYDWSYGEGMVVVNKSCQLKTAFTYWDESRNNLASWTSKYGSMTFVQYGREIAFDGMNEAGLVVSELWLEESRYPSVDSRPSISLDQYVQYLLDNFGTVDEIIASDALVRLRPLPSNFTKIHFFAADRSGDCIVVEFLEGKMVCHLKETMPVKAITNNTYESSIAYINRGAAPDPYSNASLERFYRASLLIAGYGPETPGDVIATTFKILDAVKQGIGTKFQTVFDIKNRIVYFKSQRNWQFRYFRFDAFDFSCQTASKMLDINANLSGDVTSQFSDYTWQANEALIKSAWEGLGYHDIYLPALQIISRYPETFVCKGSASADEIKNRVPIKNELDQNFPNPFSAGGGSVLGGNPSTTIRYSLEKPSAVRAAVFDNMGRKIRTLCDSYQFAGSYSMIWNATDDRNAPVGSGVYYCRLETDETSSRKKMLLIR
jgi:penicillin V acylase-like amidase (Ntn superfamily)